MSLPAILAEGPATLVSLAGSRFTHAGLETLVSAGTLLLVAFAAYVVMRQIVLRLLRRVLLHTPLADEMELLWPVMRRLTKVVPIVVVIAGVGAVPHLPPWAKQLTLNLASALVVLVLAMAVSRLFDFGSELYARRPEAAYRPVKGFVQVGKIVVYCVAAVLGVAALMDRSPLLLLSGLGAMAAVLMLVFKDTILSLVASVQIESNDLIRLGDWVTMPQCDADGDVIDIALHTVKIQNFDKTITAVPTYRFISESFRNWRGMANAGARRIMRALPIDQNSVRFLSADELAKLGQIALLAPYLDRKRQEIAKANSDLGVADDDRLNGRGLTNLGTFRAYLDAYLRAREDIAIDGQTLLVRHLAPGESGLPLEFYCFAKTTNWAVYEAIQADIVDHLLAILPSFGLRLFQKPGGSDLSGLARTEGERDQRMP